MENARPRRTWIAVVLITLGVITVLATLLLLAVGLVAWVMTGGDLEEMNVDTGSGDRVALVFIDDVIMDSTEVLRDLDRLADKDNVKALVVRIDSPGGPVVPFQEIYSGLLKWRKRTGRPIIASLGNIAASGGYYAACAADGIMSNPGTLTGSIGVILNLPQYQGLLNKIGVRMDVVKSGAYKDIGSPTRNMTAAERALLQSTMDDVHLQFIEAVAAGRKLPLTRVRKLADGRIFSGRQAKRNGLVDRLGDLDDAVDWAARRAGLDTPAKVLRPPKKRAWGLLGEARALLNQAGMCYTYWPATEGGVR